MSANNLPRAPASRGAQIMIARTVGLCLAAFVFSGLTPSPVAAERSARAPNFVFILMDDMGWRDVGFMGNDFVETPHLDRLAKGGLVFTQAYASAPNCAPTRACLMSGQYTPRHGIYTVVDPRQPPGSPWHKLQAAESKSELSPNIVTIAEALENGGYATAFFGMWNLGHGRTGPVTPGGQGFQRVVFPENVGFGKDAYFDGRGNYLSDRLADEVLQFVEQNRDKPFFAYFADHAVHAPYDPKPELLAKYQKKAAARADGRDDPAYAATIEAVDQNIGRIVDRLSQLKLTDDTVIVFTSDNGGTRQYTAPLRGSKGELYEGGIRVPLVVSWPGLKNRGRGCAAPVISIDWYPTLLDLANIQAPPGQTLDGISLAPLFAGGGEPKRDRLFWHFPCYVGRATPASAIREGDFKLIELFEDGGRRELYNLRNDPNEVRNLVEEMPEKRDALSWALRGWQTETHATVPRTPNPLYNPQAERPRGKSGSEVHGAKRLNH